jgi:hypothetical protein
MSVLGMFCVAGLRASSGSGELGMNTNRHFHTTCVILRRVLQDQREFVSASQPDVLYTRSL